MVEIVSVGLICEFLYTTIEQKRWERKPRGPAISDFYLLLSRHGCSNHMGCTAIPLHLCFLTSVPLIYILLSVLWVLSFSTLPAEILSFKTYLKRHLLREAILEHFNQRYFFFEPLELFIAIFSLHKYQVWALYGPDNGSLLSYVSFLHLVRHYLHCENEIKTHRS